MCEGREAWKVDIVFPYLSRILRGKNIESVHIFAHGYIYSRKLNKVKTLAKCWSATLYSVKPLLVPNTDFGFAVSNIT